MRRYIEWVVRYRKVVIVLTMLVTMAALFQAHSVKVVIDTAKLMPQSNPFVSTSNDVDRIFGSKHVIVIGVAPREGDVYQPAVLEKVQRITAALLKVPGVVRENLLSFSAKRAKSIIGNADGLEVRQLLSDGPVTPERVNELRRAIQENPVYRDLIVSADGKTAAIIVDFRDEPAGYATMMAKIEPIIASERDSTVRFAVAGLPNALAHLERYSERMAFLLPIAFFVLCFVLYQAFRTRQGMFLPLVTALMAVIWGVGVMGAFGIQMDAFNATTPILILAVATGHAVQLLKRYYEEYASLSRQPGADPVKSNRQAVVNSLTQLAPVMLAAGSVASLGFFSLVVFQISAVRTFGIFTGLGIIATLILELTFIPALRSTLKPPTLATVKKKGQFWFAVTDAIANVVTRPSRAPVYIVAMVIVAIAAAGITRIVEDNSVKRYFSPSLHFQQDDQFLNKNLGGTNTVYLLVEGKSSDTLKDPAVLNAMSDLQAFLEAQPGVGKTISIADFIKRMNAAMHGDNPAFYTIPSAKNLISQYLLLYSMSGEPNDFDSYVDYDYRRAKITAFIKTDSTAYTQALVQKIRAFVDAHFGPNIAVRIGGSAPQDTALNEEMVHEKLLNIIQIGAVVLIISSIIFRSATAGLLVLLPLLLAVVVNFGIMGWGGILLNIPTSLTSAMAVGIGADYAIYLIFRLRNEFAREANQEAAIRSVLHSAGEAILFVATAVALGYGVLLFSFGFYIHVWLAILIGSAMLVSAVSALVLIPSIILSLQPAFMRDRLRIRAGIETDTA
jgi:predicted RND superfamily exporter protein